MIKELPADKQFAVGDVVTVGVNEIKGVISSSILSTEWWKGRRQFLYEVSLCFADKGHRSSTMRVMTQHLKAAPSVELAREHRKDI